MTEEFWQAEKKKFESNPVNTNILLSQTEKDAKSIASDKHPKALYAECLKQSTYWTHYAASPSLSIDDMAMMLCRDLGCEVNYCGLIKKSQPMEWEGSSDCSEEIKNFNNCMIRERRRYQWMDNRPSMFDYIQTRLEEKKKEKKFENLFTQTELQAIEQLIQKMYGKQKIFYKTQSRGQAKARAGFRQEFKDALYMKYLINHHQHPQDVDQQICIEKPLENPNLKA